MTGQSIEIMQIPDGQAPEWVREAWIGLSLPIKHVNYELPVGMDDRGRLRPAIDGDILYYPIDKEVALKRLKERSPKAAEWFRENLPKLCSELFFNDSACRVK